MNERNMNERKPCRVFDPHKPLDCEFLARRLLDSELLFERTMRDAHCVLMEVRDKTDVCEEGENYWRRFVDCMKSPASLDSETQPPRST